jgi:hypothetical protein
MAKKPTISTISSGYASNTQLNNNFSALRTGFDNTLSLDGSTPNAMNADFDMNSNDILNANEINTSSLRLNGVLVSASGEVDVTSSIMSSDVFTGNGSTTVYTLSFAPFIKDNTQIYIDGVYQNKVTYSTSGNTLTFTEAPPLNSAIEVMVARILTDVGTADAGSVTYTQGGAGSVQTTVQSKLQETVSVKDFGATGDGVTDDTAAIQAAINVNIAPVYMPEGTYRITSSIRLDPATDSVVYRTAAMLFGSGKERTIILNESGDYALKIENDAYQGSTFSIDSGVVISDLKIITSGASPVGSAGIVINSSDARIEKVVIDGPKGDGIVTAVVIPTDRGQNISPIIEQCRITSADGWGIKSLNPSSSFTITNNYIVSNSEGGIYLTGGQHRITNNSIAGNGINNSSYSSGIVIRNDGFQPQSSVIQSNEFDDNQNSHIIISGLINIIIGNRFISRDADARSLDFAAISVIEDSGINFNNTFENNFFRFSELTTAITLFHFDTSASNKGNVVLNNLYFYGGTASDLKEIEFSTSGSVVTQYGNQLIHNNAKTQAFGLLASTASSYFLNAYVTSSYTIPASAASDADKRLRIANTTTTQNELYEVTYFDPVNYEVEFGSAGVYDIDIAVQMLNATASTQMTVILQKDTGSGYATLRDWLAVTSNSTDEQLLPNMREMASLEAGDKIRVLAFGDGGGTIRAVNSGVKIVQL